MLQTPVQHSPLSEQMSRGCTQYDAPSSQYPAWHRPPQHWVLDVQGLPAVLQLRLSALQTAPTQDCPQHSALLWHAAPSAVHCLGAHFPPRQLMLQHSEARVQAVPATLQTLIDETQVPRVKSQRPEQQSGADWQPCP